MKFFSKMTSFFIMIGSNTERRTKFYDYGNLAMIVYYFIQLIGYIYSQFESKTIQYYENDFLAQVSQLSSIPFMLIIIHQDILTKTVYYTVLSTMCIIFIASLFQIVLRPLPGSYLLNKFIKFYFQNFQWFFLTPFNECMIGIITCGKQSYLLQNSTIQPQNCFIEIPFHTIVTSFIGIILVSFSGTISVYFFRNYEFLSGSLLRKFSYINLMTIYLHQLLIILSFWKLMYSNHYIILHICYNFLMFCILWDVFTSLPFGFTFETIFYSQILMISLFFGGLVATWILTSLTDGIIFLTSSIFLPLIFKVNLNFFYYQFEHKSLQFCQKQTYYLSEFPLEYIVLLSHPLTMTKQSYLIAIKYLHSHCQGCVDVLCPCKNNLQSFMSTTQNFNSEVLYLWIQHQFQKLLKVAMNKQYPIELFEQLTTKYATFLQKYRDNQFLSYKNIQDIIIGFSKQQKEKDFSASFFINLTFKIQNDNKLKIEQENRSNYKLSKTEFKSVTDLNIFMFYQEQLLKNISKSLDYQKKIWFCYNNSTLNSYEGLLVAAQNIALQIQQVRRLYNKFNKLREDPNMENILILRLKFLISLTCMEDFNTQIQLGNQIINTQNEEYYISKTQFHILKYINNEAVILKSQVSFYSQGIILQTLQNKFNEFFGYLSSEQINTVEKLLPNNISVIHNGLIENFLQFGRSAKLYNSCEAFIKKKNNLIEKVSMSLTTLLPIQGNSYYFFIFAHLIKKQTQEQILVSDQQKGYILVDQNFNIFGVSDLIFSKISQFSQDNILQLIETEDLFIFFFMPYLSQIMLEYYKVKLLQNAELLDNEVIVQEMSSFFDLASKRSFDRKSKIELKNTKKGKEKDISCKQLINDLTKRQSIFQQVQAEFNIPITYSVQQKVLTPLLDGKIKQVLYFVIEIEFQEDFYQKQKRLSMQLLPSPEQLQQLEQLEEKIKSKKEQQQSRSIIHSQNQLASFESDDNGFLELQAGASSTSSQLRSQSGLYYQIKLFNTLLKTNQKPKIAVIMMTFFLLQLICTLTIILLTYIFFQQKSSIQSDCINTNSIEIDFLDAYTEIMTGSRHVIYYRDFFLYLNDSNFINGDSELNFSLLNKIVISQSHINFGIGRILTIYNDQMNIFSTNNNEHLEIALINSDLQNKIIQNVDNQKTFYQIMCSVFFMASQTFTQNISNFLYNAKDPYSTLSTRSIVYYNFFNISEITQNKLQDCKEQNIQINNQFDQVVLFFFIASYIIQIAWVIIQLNLYKKLLRNIKFYVSIFAQCDSSDVTKSLQLYENISKHLDQSSIVLSKKKFDKLLFIPTQELDLLRSLNLSLQNNLLQNQNRKDKQIKLSKRINISFNLFCIFALSLLPIIFNLSFHIYFEMIRQNIIPINQEAIQAQEIRLNFISTINRIDLYMIKQFYQAYNELAQNNSLMAITQNIYQDFQILQQVDFDVNQMELELLNLKNIDFSFFLFNSLSAQDLSFDQKSLILTQDACLLTGCDMQSELFQDRILSDQFSVYFSSGIIKLSKIVSEIFSDFYLNFESLSNIEDQINYIKQLIASQNYQIYIIWGIDIVQFQIAQFSQYFVNAALQQVINITSVSLFYIILFGILLILLVIIIFLIYINLQIQRYNLAKTIVRLIPLQIVLKRSIQKQLQNFEKRNIF